jgi:hypothetical protein
MTRPLPGMAAAMGMVVAVATGMVVAVATGTFAVAAITSRSTVFVTRVLPFAVAITAFATHTIAASLRRATTMAVATAGGCTIKPSSPAAATGGGGTGDASTGIPTMDIERLDGSP